LRTATAKDCHGRSKIWWTKPAMACFLDRAQPQILVGGDDKDAKRRDQPE
jgi:hypothetical protein